MSIGLRSCLEYHNISMSMYHTEAEARVRGREAGVMLSMLDVITGVGVSLRPEQQSADVEVGAWRPSG
jgi:hypothetical protein